MVVKGSQDEGSFHFFMAKGELWQFVLSLKDGGGYSNLGYRKTVWCAKGGGQLGEV